MKSEEIMAMVQNNTLSIVDAVNMMTNPDTFVRDRCISIVAGMVRNELENRPKKGWVRWKLYGGPERTAINVDTGEKITSVGSIVADNEEPVRRKKRDFSGKSITLEEHILRVLKRIRFRDTKLALDVEWYGDGDLLINEQGDAFRIKGDPVSEGRSFLYDVDLI